MEPNSAHFLLNHAPHVLPSSLNGIRELRRYLSGTRLMFSHIYEQLGKYQYIINAKLGKADDESSWTELSSTMFKRR